MFETGMINNPYVTASDEKNQPGLTGLMYRMMHGVGEGANALGKGVDALFGGGGTTPGGPTPDASGLFEGLF